MFLLVGWLLVIVTQKTEQVGKKLKRLSKEEKKKKKKKQDRKIILSTWTSGIR